MLLDDCARGGTVDRMTVFSGLEMTSLCTVMTALTLCLGGAALQGVITCHRVQASSRQHARAAGCGE